MTTSVDPRLALAVFAALALLAAVAAWPRVGLLARWRRAGRLSVRERLEDALKHLYHAEAAGQATVESLAGALQVTRGAAARLLERLAERELAVGEGEGWRLTEEGRAYALRVVRTHRLWERYLADRTGVAPAEWHDEAERREHQLSEAEAEALSASMGHPLVDPHGDPIPTAAGELPARGGIALAALRVGETGRIVHLEDEPREVHDRVLALGLAPSLGVTRLAGPASRVRFRAEGREHELDAVAAASVTVEPLGAEAGEETSARPRTLASVVPGASAVVLGLSAACQGPQRRRLLDLGVVPGTLIRAEFASAGGDPVAYRVRGALLALRRQQAEWIQVARDDAPAGAA